MTVKWERDGKDITEDEKAYQIISKGKFLLFCVYLPNFYRKRTYKKT